MAKPILMTPREQFERLDTFWEQLETPLSRRTYRLGPFSIALVFASPTLEQKLAKAFDHLEEPVEKLPSPDLTIGLWDSAEVKSPLPDLDWDKINRRIGYCDPPVHLYYDGTLSALCQNRGYFAVRDTAELPYWVSGSPLRVILSIWLRERGMQFTHAAAIGNRKKALLLAGKGGSGKSTTTLACLRDGLHYISEDYCVLAPNHNAPYVLSIYQSAKWQKHTRELFPYYENFITNLHEANADKALAFYRDFFPEQLSAPLGGIVSLSVGTESKPQLVRTDSHTVLARLMMSTLAQLPLYHPRTMLLLEELTNQLPGYHLVLGRDIQANCKIIRELLEIS